jgi:hypothetical protein
MVRVPGSRGLARRLTPNFAKRSSSGNWETWTRIGILYPMQRKKALEALLARKLTNGGWTSWIIAANRPCKPLLFLLLSKRSGFSQSRHCHLLKTKTETIKPAPVATARSPMFSIIRTPTRPQFWKYLAGSLD